MLLTVIFSLFTAIGAQAQTTVPGDTTPFLLCVKTCGAWYDTPGYGLQACLAECQRRHLSEPKMMTPIEAATPEWCETYEEDCDRPDTGI
jgi:hypothetical protein